MTPLQKVIKYGAIAFGFYLVFVILSAIIFGITAIFGISVGINTYKSYTSQEETIISYFEDTFEGIDKIVNLLNQRNQKGIFVNDRGYDNNLVFNNYFDKKQYYIIRLKENRKIYCNHKWYKIATIRDSHKGKINKNIILKTLE